MFDTIRNNSKILMGLLVLLIIPSFVLFGVDGYSSMKDRGAVVAKVGDLEITQQEWDAVHALAVRRSHCMDGGCAICLEEFGVRQQARMLWCECVCSCICLCGHFFAFV